MIINSKIYYFRRKTKIFYEIYKYKKKSNYKYI